MFYDFLSHWICKYYCKWIKKLLSAKLGLQVVYSAQAQKHKKGKDVVQDCLSASFLHSDLLMI